jgi:hypothetical protein
MAQKLHERGALESLVRISHAVAKPWKRETVESNRRLHQIKEAGKTRTTRPTPRPANRSWYNVELFHPAPLPLRLNAAHQTRRHQLRHRFSEPLFVAGRNVKKGHHRLLGLTEIRECEVSGRPLFSNARRPRANSSPNPMESSRDSSPVSTHSHWPVGQRRRIAIHSSSLRPPSQS